MTVLGNSELEPDFTAAQNRHTHSKQNASRGYVTGTLAAARLGISPNIFAFITGSVLIKVSDGSSHKLNIGLRFKLRQYVNMMNSPILLERVLSLFRVFFWIFRNVVTWRKTMLNPLDTHSFIRKKRSIWLRSIWAVSQPCSPSYRSMTRPSRCTYTNSLDTSMWAKRNIWNKWWIGWINCRAQKIHWKTPTLSISRPRHMTM